MSSLSPLDIDAVVRSIKKTGRLIIVDTANKTCSAASEISSIIAEDHFHLLKAPIGIVAYDNVPIPFSSKLGRALMPTPEKLLNKVKRVMGNGR
jgi:pyruvate dehydrogenase E1 component beta subunit